jgi:hypothetical protein
MVPYVRSSANSVLADVGCDTMVRGAELTLHRYGTTPLTTA